MPSRAAQSGGAEHATTGIHPRAGSLPASCGGQERMGSVRASGAGCPATRRRRDRRETHAKRAMDREVRSRRALRRSHAPVPATNGRYTLVRLDDSVEAVTPLGGNRYRADISKVGFFGLLACSPVATLRVERTDRGIRYVTEQCEMIFTGPLRRLVSGLAGIGVEACTELSARDGKLEATGDFALTLPLPRWWPVPDKAMRRGEGIAASSRRIRASRSSGWGGSSPVVSLKKPQTGV